MSKLSFWGRVMARLRGPAQISGLVDMVQARGMTAARPPTPVMGMASVIDTTNPYDTKFGL